MIEYTIWFMIIFFAGIAAEGAFELIRFYRRRAIANIKCDGCGKPRKTRKTRDKRYWMCRTCLPIYNEENPVIQKKKKEESAAE